MKPFRRLLKDQAGTAAVEFALCLPLFLMLVFGVVELGGAWYAKQMLVSASREGARMGVLYDPDGQSGQEVEAFVSNLLSQTNFPGTFQVSATGVESSPGGVVQVAVTANYQFPVLGSLVPGFSNALTLSASTAMRHE